MADPRNKPIWRARKFNDPAAGANLVITPDTAATWLVRSIALTIVTGANPGTRSAILAADNGSDVWFRASPGATQANSITRFYGGFAGSAGAAAQGSAISWGLPTDGLWLPRGHRLITAIENIDPADQISAVVLFLIEFPTGSAEEFWPIPPMMLESSE